MDFQHRVSAWLAVLILAEKDAVMPWCLPAGTTLDWLRCETEQPIDDIMAGTSAGGLIFIQAKKTLNLSTRDGSDLASAVDQCVRQVVSMRNKPTGSRPWDRAADPARDRFVIATSPESSKAIVSDAGRMLDRVRGLVSGAPLMDAAVNDHEQSALHALTAHANTSWQRVTGAAPSEAELRQLLGLVRFEALDLMGGKDEAAAKQALKAATLSNPDQADSAWSQLVTTCSELASRRSSINRQGLQTQLMGHGIRLQVPRSYRADIEKLRAQSESTSEGLNQLSVILVGQQNVWIDRPIKAVLRDEAEQASLLVVGEPGAGKSGALHGLVEILKKEGRDYVFIAVDRLAAGSLPAIRQELGLEHELVNVLTNWPSSQPKFLIIDALDAARGNILGGAVRELISSVIGDSNWRVIASIRKFDLRYGTELRRLFRGGAISGLVDPEFVDVRHLNVGTLTKEELAQVEASSPELGELIKSASGALKDLMSQPFHLRLLADMLGSGLKPGDLSPIASTMELLERYWVHRVIDADHDHDGDSRETVLRDVVQKMVESRALRVERAAVAKAGAGPSIYRLLSQRVMVEWQQGIASLPNREVLAFSHHVLFDYSAARLMFRGCPDALIEKLRDDTQLAIVVRPSILMHFQHLWAADTDHGQFWDLTIRLMNANGVPQIAKLIGPYVAAESLATLGDLDALCAAMESKTEVVRTSGESAFRHLVGALLVEESGPSKLDAADLELWCSVLERVTRTMSDPIAYSIRPLLLTFCDHTERLPPDGFKHAGEVARRLLDYAWKRPQRDHWLVVAGLLCVSRTFESDVFASEALLRKTLEKDHLAQFGFEELPWITRDIKRIFRHSPSFTEELYKRAFAFKEASDEPTAMAPGRIFSFTSNRRQDYNMALFQLGEAFPELMDTNLPAAARILVATANNYALQDHASSSGEIQEQAYDLGGLSGVLRIDYSSIWDGGTYRHDDAMKMVDAFQKKLESLAKEGDTAALRMVVAEAVTQNRSGFLWRRILMVAAENPQSLGEIVRPLTTSSAMLKSIDTTYPMAALLKALGPAMAPDEKERVETTILCLGTDRDIGFPASENTQHRLLVALADAGSLVTAEARKIMDELRSADKVPSYEEPERLRSYSRAFGEVEYLAEQGVDVDAEPNRRLRTLEAPVKEFAEQNLNGVPTAEQIKSIVPAMRELREALLAAERDGVARQQADHAMHYLVAVAARIARTDLKESPEGDLARDILLDGAVHPEPVHHPEYDAQFDKSPSWGSPAARIEAAAGMTVLARSAPYATQAVRDAIATLAKDPVPAVRYQVACALNTISRTAPELMWGIIEDMCRAESSRSVLQGLVAGPIQNLAPSSVERVVGLLLIILDRVKDGPGAGTVRNFCIGLISGLHIWRNAARCEAVVYSIAEHPLSNIDAASTLVRNFREASTEGPVEPADPTKDAVRYRIWKLIETLLKSSIDEVHGILARNKGVLYGEWAKADQEAVKDLNRLIDHIGTELYFASGAYNPGGQAADDSDGHMPGGKACRYYEESRASFELLASSGLPSVTHNLMKILEYMVDFDPPAVFKQVGKIVGFGKAGGFQYESMAADQVVRLVERYLAEYREVLQTDPECRHVLMEILDAFVEAGWPSARQLTYRLDEIFK
ncbi:NACHT domain-containing protein [Metallibacterium sp.]